MKKRLTLVLTMLMLVIGMAFTAQAATKKPVCPKRQTVYFNYRSLTPIKNASSVIYIKNLKKSAKITDCKFSNSTVNKIVEAYDGLHVRKGADAKGVRLWISSESGTLKDGMQSKLTFTVEQDSKKYKLSCIVTFKEEPQIFKSLKICGQECAETVWKPDFFRLAYEDFAKKKGKIKVRMNSGLKLKKIEVEYVAQYSGALSRKTIKNGGKITLKKGGKVMWTAITITYKHEKRPQYYSDMHIGDADYEGIFLTDTFTIRI